MLAAYIKKEILSNRLLLYLIDIIKKNGDFFLTVAAFFMREYDPGTPYDLSLNLRCFKAV